jgi:TPR repeat protein
MTEVQANLNDLAFRAECGDPEAQYSMGVHCLLGELLQQDLDASYQWLMRAACGEHPAAQSLVGKLAPNAFVPHSQGQSKSRSVYDELVRRIRRLARFAIQQDGPTLSGTLSQARVRFKIRF